MESESAVESWLGRQLRQEGFMYFKFVSPQNPGVPDRLVICPDGAVVFVELKTATGRLSKRQQICIQDLMRHGQRVAVVHGMAEAKLVARLLIDKYGGGQGGKI